LSATDLVDVLATLQTQDGGMKVISGLKDQLLIAFLTELGGEISLTVAEVDSCGAQALEIGLDQDTKTFHFQVVSRH